MFIHKALKNNKRKVHFPSATKVKTIGIICDANNNETSLSIPFIKNAKHSVLKIHNTRRPKQNSDMAVYKSDRNLLGLPTKKWIIPFIDETFDILIDLTDGTNQAIEYICARSVAGFKTGTNPESRVYDLIIKHNFENSNSFINEIERTLNNLNQ
ncbi:MAG: hypothetical protein PF436_11660 [Prolixibacteraceae bacterium]|nr:hypothetical protein [Prolixibacteraceae bacterium]